MSLHTNHHLSPQGDVIPMFGLALLACTRKGQLAFDFNITEVHGRKFNPLSAISALPRSETQSLYLEPKALPESVLGPLQAKYAPRIAERVLARLSEAERREVNLHLKQDYRQAWICLSLALKANPDPFVASSYVVYGTHPDKVFAKWLDEQKARLAAEFGQWYTEQGCLIPEPSSAKFPPQAANADSHSANGAGLHGTSGPVPNHDKETA